MFNEDTLFGSCLDFGDYGEGLDMGGSLEVYDKVADVIYVTRKDTGVTVKFEVEDNGYGWICYRSSAIFFDGSDIDKTIPIEIVLE